MKITENKFKNEIVKKLKIVDKSYLQHFQYVKQQRWLADYSHEYLDESICKECIAKTKDFLDEIRKHIN